MRSIEFARSQPGSETPEGSFTCGGPLWPRPPACGRPGFSGRPRWEAVLADRETVINWFGEPD
jgi:hypothetical protein